MNSGDTILISQRRPDHAMFRAMARLARIVVPGAPHHVTQRGNRREYQGHYTD